MTDSPGVPLLETLTWPEVQSALESGFRTVIVACGAIEQHGPHLPLLVDAEHATRLAVEIATRMGQTLVAPTIRVGCSDHHLAFPGTISIGPNTLEALYADYCTSLAHHGFEKICCFSAHGGNFRVLADMTDRLNQCVAPHSRVVSYTDLRAFLNLWHDVTQGCTGRGSQVGGHADITESSIALVLRPDLVRVEAAQPGYTGPMDDEVLAEAFEKGFRTLASNGILGDPRGMDAALGVQCIDTMADLMTDYFQSN